MKLKTVSVESRDKGWQRPLSWQAQTEESRAAGALWKQAHDKRGLDAAFWAELFSAQLREERQDDMVFYASRVDQEGEKGQENGFVDLGGYFVRRRSAAAHPRPDSRAVDWEASFFLDAMCHGLKYRLVVTARRGGKKPEAAVGGREVEEDKKKREEGAGRHRVAVEVHASPSLCPLGDEKSEQRSTFPLLSFQVHDTWNHGAVLLGAERDDQEAAATNRQEKKEDQEKPEERIAVELVAKGNFLGRSMRKTVWGGVLTATAVREAVARERERKKQAGGWSVLWQGREEKKADTHVALKGPRGKGEASLAVAAVPVQAPEAPEVPEVSGGWRAWLRKSPSQPEVLRCMVSHVSVHYRELADKLMSQDP